MATHNTGTTATLGQSAHTVPFTFTIPAGVLAGDVMLVSVNTFSFPLTGPATSTPTSGGGSWTAVGPLVAAQDGTAGVSATAWHRVATAGDPGSTFTMSWTGGVGGTDGFWWTATHDSYTGFWTPDPVAQSITPTSGAQTAVGSCPSGTSLRSGSWVVQLGPITPNSSGTITGVPSGMTQRQLSNGNSGVSCASADSGASVGAAGTPIGGGSFTTSNATDNWWAEWTIELATVGAPAAAVSAPTPPPLIAPHPLFTEALLGHAWERADWQAQGVADLSVSFASTSGGVDTYNALSPWNGGVTQQMRVLAPTAPAAGYPRAFLVMLPVDPDQDTTFGDSIGIAQGLGAHNAYNLTCVQPGYAAAAGTGPWFGDNPLDPSVSQEKYTLLVVAWIRANLAVTGSEKVYLIGFSRSGLAAQFLLFRHPDLFAAAASWDSPVMMEDATGADSTNGSSIGGSPVNVFATTANFQTNYQLAPHLAGWQATGQWAVNRIWLGLGPAFPADPPAYDAALTGAGIPHSYGFSNTGESHAWHSDWVAAALAAIIPSNWAQAATVLPQQVPHPLLESLLDLASLRLDPGSDGAAATVQGTASLSGAGALSALSALSAPAALSGAGGVAGLSAQAAGSGITGAGSLAALVTEAAIASLSGAGAVSASPGAGQTASLSGAGSLSAVAVVSAPCFPSGAGSLSAAAVQGAVTVPAGTGTLAALAALQAAAAVTGGGAVTAAGAQVSPTAFGRSTAAGRAAATATAAGGTVTSAIPGGQP
jgi:hypothetical protein